MAALLSRSGISAKATRDLDAILWQKAVVNAAINPVTAVLGVPNGHILRQTESRLVSRLAAGEAARVAAAQGVAVRRPWSAVCRVLEATAQNRSSMLQDVQAGRQTEIESITGEVVRRARRHRIAVPVNAGLLDAVRSL